MPEVATELAPAVPMRVTARGASVPLKVMVHAVVSRVTPAGVPSRARL